MMSKIDCRRGRDGGKGKGGGFRKGLSEVLAKEETGGAKKEGD